MRCTARELLIIASAYSVEAVAKRMGFEDVQKFIEETKRKAGQ